MENQGYTIEAMEAIQVSANIRYGFALGRSPSGIMWVTWAYSWDGVEGHDPDYYWGHYFEDSNKARADYHHRLADEYDALGG